MTYPEHLEEDDASSREFAKLFSHWSYPRCLHLLSSPPAPISSVDDGSMRTLGQPFALQSFGYSISA
jgi:hypothetical protein